MHAIRIDDSEIRMEDSWPVPLTPVQTSDCPGDALETDTSARATPQAMSETRLHGNRRPAINPPRKETARKSVRLPGDSSGWLNENPFQWRGRKIRNRKTRLVYTIRQVFHSGTVELEKTFMVYLTNVKAIRKEYEPEI